MSRHKKFFKLPFFKFKIQRNTSKTLIGLAIWAGAIFSLLSFFQSGSTLILLNANLVRFFGGLSLVIPVILASFGSHFFNSKKLKIVSPNVSLGLLLIFLAFLGVLRAGSVGARIAESLIADFSLLGGFLIMFLTFLVGVILFFNTSVDVFILNTIGFIKTVINLARTYLFREVSNGKRGSQQSESDSEFIKDRRVVTPVRNSQLPVAQQTDGLNIRPFKKLSGVWQYPPISLLADLPDQTADTGDTKKNSDTIEKTLDSFGVRARVSEINEGPTVSQYALEIVRGTKLTKITTLANDLALALAAPTGQVRIEAPIPGRSLVGIEIPNRRAQIVALKELLGSRLMQEHASPLFMPLGLDVSGKAYGVDITKMPHVLIAGTTGAGKSVLLNSWICSMLFRASPEEVRLILVDPKRVELTPYNGIPHLLTEVIVDPKKIISALKWTVGEMENRYKLFSEAKVRNIESFNQLKNTEHVPYIIFIIDELADLMIFAANEAEELITRIAQMARATGIHLILATQRPSVDVITGLMKANIPARIAFNVASMVDSRVVLDMPGAEKLLGKGDMLFMPPDQAKPKRIQSPLIPESDVSAVVDHLRKSFPEVHYTDEVTEQEVTIKGKTGRMSGMGGGDHDDLFDQAINAIYSDGKGSASLLQRRLSIGYARAARILDQLQEEGYVGPAQGSKPREIIRSAAAGSVEEAAIPDED